MDDVKWAREGAPREEMDRLINAFLFQKPRDATAMEPQKGF